MKTPLYLLTLAASLAFAFPAPAADKAPSTLSIEAALKIAQNYLKGKPEQRSIVALTLESTTIRGGQYWYAKWSSPILTEAKPELGLQIGMNGDVQRVVSGNSGNTNGNAGELPKGQRRYGARDMR